LVFILSFPIFITTGLFYFFGWYSSLYSLVAYPICVCFSVNFMYLFLALLNLIFKPNDFRLERILKEVFIRKLLRGNIFIGLQLLVSLFEHKTIDQFARMDKELRHVSDLTEGSQCPDIPLVSVDIKKEIRLFQILEGNDSENYGNSDNRITVLNFGSYT